MKENMKNQISENNITLDAFAGDYYDENNNVSSVSRKLFEMRSRLKEALSRQK